MPARKKSDTNFVPEVPKQGWAYFEDTSQWRRTPEPWGAPRNHFPKEYGDWVAVSKPKGWQPPAGTLAGESLLGAGAASLELFAPGGDANNAGLPAGGHTKIGAGRKPQGYDGHGRYTGPRGGSIAMNGGPVRLYADEADGDSSDAGSAEEDAGDELEKEAEEVYQELEGVLIADSGRIMSDAGGGLSGGNEVRGPVTQPSASVTWKNDDPNKPDPKPEELKPQMRETVENLRTNTPKLDSIDVNSGKRDGAPKTDPHADGRAVDINRVNGIPVKDLGKAQGREADRAREAAENMVEQAKNNKNVNQILGPTGCWERDKNGEWKQYDPSKLENADLIKNHQNHYHINVYRK